MVLGPSAACVVAAVEAAWHRLEPYLASSGAASPVIVIITITASANYGLSSIGHNSNTHNLPVAAAVVSPVAAAQPVVAAVVAVPVVLEYDCSCPSPWPGSLAAP